MIKFSYSSVNILPMGLSGLWPFECEKHLLMQYIQSKIGKCAKTVIPLAQYPPFPGILYWQV